MINKILIPIEFNQFDIGTYHYGLKLAQLFNTQIMVMHAYGKEDTAIGRASGPANKDHIQEKLNNFVQEKTPAVYQPVTVESMAIIDYPAEGILKVAKDNNIDLIILSSESRTNPGITSLSDQVLKIIRQAEAMVMVIPPAISEAQIRRMVFTTNFEFDDLITINMLKEWANLLNAKLHILHVGDDKPKEIQRINALEKAYSGQNHLTFDYVTGAKVQESIASFSEAIKADLIIFTTHKRGLVSTLLEGSITQKLAHKSNVPMLVVKNA